MTHPFRPPSSADPAPDAVPDPASATDRPDPDETRAKQERAARAAAETAEAEARARLRQEAREAGHAEGLRQGREQALAAITDAIGPAVARLEALQARLETEQAAHQEEMARAAIELGKVLAETLIGAPRPFDREALLQRVLAEARAEAAQDALPLICRAAPETLDQITPALPAPVRPLPDAAMKPGGFVIELLESEAGTALNRWDASVERMEQCLRALPADV
ncbi:hypothetical protein U879_11675 [Defluviimonas sp. 20V17]|uniref:Flagellar biosynthesis/type III secretory pathway protein FliH n=1 Tax=Allgaiera indica TaxID=765699 RepID=A0AAN4UN36_9RHOB|nr:hypothetical protein [Allgaiera indica]KDB03470.1 hypothetical protein U879_11675 [Defluviimonas sp. 20V17]GHD98154.1 hypothetical protein GCM10008024_00530 [Allgaiera indica]SDW52772.1 Flagellar biosynthesis/type III secretory pathway protein FliH [Allgaiera indica]